MKFKIFVVAGAIILIGAFAAFSDRFDFSSSEKEVAISGERGEGKLVLTVNEGSGQERNFESNFNEGLTAFQFLKETMEENGIFLGTKTYDFGTMVETIGSKSNGQDGLYWMYYVNGELPMAGADQYVLNPGDRVEFKFEKSAF